MEAGAALIEALIDSGVDTAFTVPGESFLTALEALRLNRNRLRLISVRQEGGGSLAAHGYAQIKGFPAAVFVSRGPGATNASIGLHAAHQDSIPMVMFIGQVRSYMKGREAFQEIDPHSAFKSMTKAVLEPSSPDQLPEMTRQAIDISINGRPGPVVVVMPRDYGETDVCSPELKGPVTRNIIKAEPEQIKILCKALNTTNRLLVIAGELARSSRAKEALGRFMNQVQAPLLCAYRCQDVIDNFHPSYAGHLEINPVSYQTKLLQEAEFILVIGSRLDGITSREESLITKDKNWAHIYPDQNILDRFHSNISIYSDVELSLANILPKLKNVSVDRIVWRDKAHGQYLHLSEPGSYKAKGNIDLSIVAAQARKILPDNAVVVTDGGSYARWIHRFFRFRDTLTQGGTASGAMGGGVPGSIGAFLATNDGRPIVAFAGDGGFMMTGQELSTAVRENIPIKIIVCDNQIHGSIFKGQVDKYGEENVFGTIMGSPDFAQLARGYGATAWTVTDTLQWEATFKSALKNPGPSLIHLKVDTRDIAPYGAEKDAV